jgi:hypothetical protein
MLGFKTIYSDTFAEVSSWCGGLNFGGFIPISLSNASNMNTRKGPLSEWMKGL